MTDLIKWAIHKDAEADGRIEIGLKNLTKNEAEVILLTLNRLQLCRETNEGAASGVPEKAGS